MKHRIILFSQFRSFPGKALSALLTSSFVLILVLLSSGIARSVFHTSFGISLAISSTAMIVVSILFYKHAELPRLSPLCCILGFIAPAALLTHILYRMNLFGLATNGVADAGLHVLYYTDFAKKEFDAYHGFITYYTLIKWIRLFIVQNHYLAFLYGLYAGFVFLLSIFFISLFGLNSLNSVSFRDRAVQLFLFLACAVLLFLPMYSEFMMSGAFVHAFSCIAIPLGALLYAISSSFQMRILASIMCIVFLRYSYGLNLGELLLSCGILSLGESFRYSGLKRVIGIGFGFACSIASYFAYSELSKIFGVGGASIPVSLPMVWLGLGLSIIAAVVTIVGKEQPGLSEVQRKLVIFAASFSLVFICTQAALTIKGVTLFYYGFKQTIYPVITSVIASSVLFAAQAKEIFQKDSSSRQKLSLALTTLSLAILCWAYAPYRQDVYNGKHEKLVDLRAWNVIEETLKTKQKRFGGFVCHSWPRFSFINGAYGLKNSITAFTNGSFIERRRHCIFWESSRVEWNWIIKNSITHHGTVSGRLVQMIERARSVNPDAVTRVRLGRGSEISYVCL